ncbi:MAG: hypothetical protein ACK4OM_03880 [Alphaproteobacteria bacterium]
MVSKISDDDTKILKSIKQNIATVFGNDVKAEQNKSDGKSSLEENFSNSLVDRVKKDFTKLDQNLNEIDARRELPGQEKKISPEKLKDYYKRAHKHFEKTKNLVMDSLEADKPININEQDQLKALVKTLDLTMNKLDKKLQAQQQEIEKELEQIRQIEEHEKKKEKGFMGKFVEQADKAFDALAAILLPPDWYQKSKENEIEIDNTKPKDKSVEKKSISNEKHENKSQKLDNSVSLNDLGNLSPPSVPNMAQGKAQGISH